MNEKQEFKVDENTPNKIKSQFQNAISYKENIKLNKTIERCVLFENGTQWVTTPNLDNYTKIVLNIVKQIGKTRKSNIMQNEYGYLVNSTSFKSIRKIQDFLKHLANVTRLKRLDLKVLNDDYVKGTAIIYFYWDAEKRGFLKKNGGEMRAEVVDIRNFAVANPYIQNIQDQEYVIVNTVEKVGSIQKKYGKTVPSDARIYTSSTEPQETTYDNSEDPVNVYTKFYRNEDGQVCFVIATETEILKKESAINPYYKGKDFEEQPNTTSTFDDKKRNDKRSGYVWNLYPFARLCLNERDNCFYGIPIASEYLETQKSINNHFSVYDKALEDNVLGGFIYRKGAVDPTEITTENGQMVGIESNMNEPITNAFGRFPAGNVPNDSANYSQNLIGVAKSVAGVSNVQLGMSDFAGQSGKQTQLLLDRAKENATDNAMQFNEYKIDQAEIMFLFAKFFYDNENFVITEHGVKQDNAREYKGDESFNGSDYMDDYVTIDIRVGAAPSFSEYNNIEITGLMVQSGQLPFEAYVNMMPEGYLSNRQEVVDILKNNSNLKIASLEKMIEQQNQVMQQMSEAYKQTQKDMQNITTVISENERLKSMLAEVSANNIKNMQEISAQNARMTGEMQKLLSIVGKK